MEFLAIDITHYNRVITIIQAKNVHKAIIKARRILKGKIIHSLKNNADELDNRIIDIYNNEIILRIKG
jgi:hypothetical protein